MASQNFKKALEHVLVYEGGYSNHPKDPGGVTLEGVIQRVYDGYRKRAGKPQQALKASMRGKAAWTKERDAIYRQQYWDMIRGDELPSGVDFVVFDGAVNSGPSQSVKWLQRALKVTADGNIGEATLAAIAANSDHEKLIADICGRRLAFLKQLKTWKTFGKGWGARVASVKATGQALVEGDVSPKVATATSDEGSAKAAPSDLAEAPVPVGVGTAGTTIGTVTTGAIDTLQTTSTALEPLSEGIQIVKYVVVAITLVIATITIYGIYRSYKAQRARNGEDSVLVPAGVGLMFDWINPLYAYLGLGGVTIAALVAVAIYFPPFRKIALAVAGAIAAGLAIYAKGSKDASKRASEQRKRDEQRAIDRAKAARAGAERDIADDPAGLRDKYNRDN